MTPVLIPFSLWTTQRPDAAPESAYLAKTDLPHLRQWLSKAKRTEVHHDPDASPYLAALSPPHERALAQTMGWPILDGLLPWAAQAASRPGHWAFMTLCHWHVSNGQVTLSDPAQLQIDAETDEVLFNAMKGFFAEDGITLYRHLPGQWLAESALFANLPTASIDRVIGRNIDPWLVRGDNLLRRLQNEMQMLLYTHPVNDGRSMTINSFWLHGTGELLTVNAVNTADITVVDTLRRSALEQDFVGWVEAWQEVDAKVLATQPSRLVLCGEHEFHVYDLAAPSLLQRLRHFISPNTLSQVLCVPPLKEQD